MELQKSETRRILIWMSAGYTVLFACVAGLIAYLALKPEIVEEIVEEVEYLGEEMDWPEQDMLAGKEYSGLFDGLDISRYQGRIQWEELKGGNEQLKFLYVRVFGRDMNMDEVYHINVKHAREHSIPVGTYMFFTMRQSAKEQFRVFRETVRRDLQDLIPVIDVEDQSIDGDATHLRDSVMLIARLMEQEYGAKPMIYSNQNHYRKHLSPEFDSYPLWIANYSREPCVGGARPVLWQCSETGHVRGIWTYVDLDRFVNGATLNRIMLPRLSPAQ